MAKNQRVNRQTKSRPKNVANAIQARNQGVIIRFPHTETAPRQPANEIRPNHI